MTCISEPKGHVCPCTRLRTHMHATSLWPHKRANTFPLANGAGLRPPLSFRSTASPRQKHFVNVRSLCSTLSLTITAAKRRAMSLLAWKWEYHILGWLTWTQRQLRVHWTLVFVVWWFPKRWLSGPALPVVLSMDLVGFQGVEKKYASTTNWLQRTKSPIAIFDWSRTAAAGVKSLLL